MERTKLLILRVTNRCNLACRYCYAAPDGSDENKGIAGGCADNTADMSFETAVKAINLIASPGSKLKIQFTGGEPLLCPQLMEQVAKYTNRKGIWASYSLQTNGTLLTPQNCQLLKKMRCGVGVSLDGMGEANGLRCYPDGTPAFEAAVNGIRNLAQAGIQCNLNAVISRQNQHRLEELLDLAAYLQNVRGIGLDMFRPIGRGVKNDFSPELENLPADLTRLLEKQKILSDLGVQIRIKELEKVRVMRQKGVQESCYCYAQTGDSFAVDPAGDIYPCSSFVGMPDMRMGNVEDSFFPTLFPTN